MLDVDNQRATIRLLARDGGSRRAESGDEGREVGLVSRIGAGGAPMGGMQETKLVVDKEEGCLGP